ncbi:MAG: hypothetical protein ACFCA4_09970 [Cyanophyceae cyanobacterium]
MKKSGLTYKSLLVGLGTVACLAVVVTGAWSGGWINSPAFGATGLVQNLPKPLTTGVSLGLWGLGGSAAVGAGLMRLWSARQFRQRLGDRDRQIGTLREELAQYQIETEQLQTDQQVLDHDNQTLQRQLSQVKELEQQQRQERGLALQQIKQLEQELSQSQDHIETITASHGRDLEEIQADVESTWDEYDRVCQEREGLKAAVAELRQALENTQSNVDALMKHQGQGASENGDDAEAGDGEDRGTFADLNEAVAAAGEDFGDVLEIWESAIASAAESQFGRPDEVYRALRAIAEIGRQYFAEGQEVSGGWRNDFKQYGLDYKPTEHQVTKTMYGSDRDFRHQGRKQRMLKHITLGRNSVVHNLQIYFEVDRNRQKIDIGYCGKHLRCYNWDS